MFTWLSKLFSNNSAPPFIVLDFSSTGDKDDLESALLDILTNQYQIPAEKININPQADGCRVRIYAPISLEDFELLGGLLALHSGHIVIVNFHKKPTRKTIDYYFQATEEAAD